MNTPVKFELAKSLNYKGLPGLKSFYDDKKQYELNPKKYTITEVVMWLYEKHGIWINIKHLPFNQKFGVSITGKYQEGSNGVLASYNFTHYNSPTEAYEAAIEYTLKNLI